MTKQATQSRKWLFLNVENYNDSLNSIAHIIESSSQSDFDGPVLLQTDVLGSINPLVCISQSHPNVRLGEQCDWLIPEEFRQRKREEEKALFYCQQGSNYLKYYTILSHFVHFSSDLLNPLFPSSKHGYRARWAPLKY